MAVKDIASTEECDKLVAAFSGKFTVLFFYADFHEPSKRGGQMDMVFGQLAKQQPVDTAMFLRVDAEAEACEDLAERYSVDNVPSYVFLAQDGKVLDSFTGADAPKLSRTIAALSTGVGVTASKSGGSVGASQDGMKKRLGQLVRAANVMLFMKGTPSKPRCKFSRKVVALLQEIGAQFGSFDILQDEQVRQGLKAFSDWKTYPQLYVAGKLIGGHDIIVELAEEDELAKLVNPPVPPPLPSLNEKLKALISQSEVMMFMKGSPDAPRCGFSRKMVALLQEHNVAFDSFDILTNDAVRSGLKTYSNWPTYPQLYVNSKLIGGLDILTDMAEEDDESLASQLGVVAKVPLEKRIRDAIHAHKVMVFIKGTPDAPRCGFSRRICELLKTTYKDIPFGTFDILEDQEIRAGIKTYSNWPTFPQLYVSDKLIGGLDIVTELDADDELREVLLGDQ